MPQHHEALASAQVQTLIFLERVGGCISLVAVMLIFVAYALVRRVRNVQNTFIVFASVSNIGASVACIIAMDGIKAGEKTALCQAQSFMFEMFMQSDPWWSLAMAINVFLVFYFRLSPDAFKRWWWLYCIICYGGPFVIALSLLLVRKRGRGPVYGTAEIWCWVDREWDYIRIYTYYMLIWICISGSILCYVMVGYCVFRSRNRVRSLSTVKSREDRETKTGTVRTGSSASSYGEHMSDLRRGPLQMDVEAAPQDTFYGTVITEVQVIHTTASPIMVPPPPKSGQSSAAAVHVSFEEPEPEPQRAPGQYFSSVTSTPPRAPRPSRSQRLRTTFQTAASKFVIEDPIKRAYLRTSLLFALSVLVTWIPSSLNRIHSWLDGGSPFEYHVSTAAVLPLQGLWNAVIFFVTSWNALSSWARGARGSSWHDVADGARDDAALGGRHVVRDDGIGDSDLEGVETGTMGSDVELRGLSSKTSTST